MNPILTGAAFIALGALAFSPLLLVFGHKKTATAAYLLALAAVGFIVIGGAL